MSSVRPSDTEAPRGFPGEAGFWVFLFADMVMFAVLFATVIVLRADDPALLAQSQEALSRGLGAANTLLLLTGSLFVVLAVGAVRTGSGRAERHLVGGIASGVAFLGVKAYEWGTKFSDGITPSTNEFFSLYFMLTGIHLAHVLIGLGVLLAMLHAVRRAPTGPSVSFIEGGACYWHLVDLLWVVLFPLLYLMR